MKRVLISVRKRWCVRRSDQRLIHVAKLLIGATNNPCSVVQDNSSPSVICPPPPSLSYSPPQNAPTSFPPFPNGNRTPNKRVSPAPSNFPISAKPGDSCPASHSEPRNSTITPNGRMYGLATSQIDVGV